jgi:hypothetical protein
MFNGCSSLKTITCLAKSCNRNHAANWTTGVAKTGLFYKSSGSSWSVGTYGIPSGWTSQIYSENNT